MAFNLRFPGNPRPCPRPRAVKGRGAYYPQWYTNQKEAWAILARSQMNAAEIEPIQGDVKMNIHFYRATHHTADIDNLAKSVLDALNGIAYHDDAQVIELNLKLTRGVGNLKAGTNVTIQPVNQKLPAYPAWELEHFHLLCRF